ncbi:formate/nitrite transporter family protein [Haloplanus halobius]|uniref:formate/nitrite transporter family protein n=1 Tax=Haloplanus halobius TaxID=2934938 RepID=UPI0020105693|nr:formate/nitrite transporter family protein [Haloplanus sp. XH21]
MADEEPPDPEETLREAVESSRSGAPAVGEVVRDRFSTDEVFQRIVAAADEEITAGNRELFFSGLAAGFAITITFLLYVSLTASTDGHPVLSALLYPLGFIYIIIGGYQLYTENTLPPVALTLERLVSVPALMRTWVVVLLGNFAGGTLGAAALAWGGIFSPSAAAAAVSIGQKGIETAPETLFVKAAFAGLIVAGVVWVEYAARDTISRIVVVYLAFLSVPLGNLFHVVVSYTEMVYLVFVTDLSVWTGVVGFVGPVLLGNTIGGVVLVTVVNYFQTTERRLESARFEGAKRQLSPSEWLFGGLSGRSYVPLVDTGDHLAAEADGPYRVIVPIANPRTETQLVELACLIASEREDAVVHPVHVVQVPEARGGYGFGQHERIIEESDELLEGVRTQIADHGLDAETSTIVSHRSFEEIFDVAERENADLVMIGWDDSRPWSTGRSARPLTELHSTPPCDFLALRDRDLDTSRVLVPTVDSADCALAAEVARALHTSVGSAVTLLHVVASPEERAAGEEFLERWATDHGLHDADLIVDDSGDVEDAIAREATDNSLVIAGAVERGLLSRLVADTLRLDVIDRIDCSVLLAEREESRSLRERLFGRQTDSREPVDR